MATSQPRFTVNVKYGSGRALSIQADPSWDVGRLKEEISKVKNIPKEEVRILFQGREIHDRFAIKHSDLGNNSVLHAVQRTEPLTLEAEMPTQSMHTLPNETEIPEAYKSQFYVYCKDICKAVKPGKIRVRCKKCQNGAFEVDRDPDGWYDVLEPNQITGKCHNSGSCNANIAEFFFKCKEHEVGEHDTSAVLHLIRPNRNQVNCIICYEECNPVIVWPCDDKHTICLECFREYCHTKLQERAFIQNNEIGYTLPCPGPDDSCNEAYVDDPHHFRILGPDEYERYKNFATEECVLQMGGVLCPATGCGQPLIPEHTWRKIQCYCGHVFCRECKGPYHNGECRSTSEPEPNPTASFRVDRDRADQARYDSEREVERISKPCPQCKVPTEKDGGCMHMTCSRCRFNWCWICNIEWNRGCQGNHWFGPDR